VDGAAFKKYPATDFSDFDQHLPVFDLHRVHSDFCGWIVCGLSSLRVPGPPMPRTDQLPFFDDSLPQRSAAMQADVVHRGDLPVYIGDANHPVAAGELFGFIVWGKFGLGAEFGEHGSKKQHLASVGCCRIAEVVQSVLSAKCPCYFGCKV
jgi:hypothetical protein